MDQGGFSEIHKAIWLDGPIDSWNFDKQQWNRWKLQTGYEVILKNLNNSSSLDDKFLSEWKNHYDCQKKSFSKFIQFFGITQDPINLNYIIVMSYAKKGSLKKCLSDIVNLKWQDKLQLLKSIISGLKIIHESGLVHCDFHDGNILISDNYNESYIIDLGLCKPVSDIQDSDKIDKNYGVLPYMAPEVLRNNPYTPASDIYSFSMIMWEFTSGIPPYNNKAHDYDLVLDICKGERPEIIKNTPKCYIDLMEKCWDSDPSKRPTIKVLENIISQWLSYVNKYYELNGDGDDEIIINGLIINEIIIYEMLVNNNKNIENQFRSDMYEFIEANKVLTQEPANTSIIQFHSRACYTSRLLIEILDQRNSDCFDCVIED
ncbi:kinase-like domain-containing protein [Glomus cerebriforme]|uniref:Kinase-like domain-containing protein n=1 Tax=Glomus cerebriforme TaxID=658196 RepID=A0A397TK38_9GLOM|nr:kinase-like domain-containing protein [Glomus cerebriforme]